MKEYLKTFLLRGLIFSGFGPIILGIVYAVLQGTVDDFSLNGVQVLVGVISTYLLAFVHAGCSVFNQIERWAVGKSLLFHLLTLYTAYITVYLVNVWIPFDLKIVLIFTVSFLVGYFAIWLTVMLITRGVQRRLNARLPR